MVSCNGKFVPAIGIRSSTLHVADFAQVATKVMYMYIYVVDEYRCVLDSWDCHWA